MQQARSMWKSSLTDAEAANRLAAHTLSINLSAVYDGLM
jgi:hypothetical protein